MTAPLRVRDFDDAAAFLRAAGTYLYAREAEHNLMIGIAEALVASGSAAPPPTLLTVERGDDVVAAAVRTPPYPLLVATAPPEAMVALGSELAARHRGGAPLGGVNGPDGTAHAFAEAYADALRLPVVVRLALRLYRLTAVRPADRPGGTLRRAAEDDRPLLERFFAGFQVDADLQVHTDPVEHVTRYLDGPGRALYLWEVGGEPVSMAGWAAPTRHGVRISAVYTPPPHRRRGYAGALVAALCQRLLDEGRRYCLLYTDLGNPTSNHVYRDVGFEPLMDAVEIEFATPAPA